MKTAKFIYKGDRGTVYGTVTLKNDGKVSVNLSNASRYSANTRLLAKNLANAIVKADFKHEAAYDFKEVKSYLDSRLVAELRNHTKELHDLYIEQTKKYADQKFAYCEERRNWKDLRWYKEYKLPTKICNKGTSMEFEGLGDNYDWKVYAEMERHRNSVRKILKMGLEAFKAEEVKYAEDHYTSSIERLSMELNKKGIVDDSEFTITSGMIGMNFECNIHHEHGLTRAWTIIASGPIQRPHYRYLVK